MNTCGLRAIEWLH